MNSIKIGTPSVHLSSRMCGSTHQRICVVCSENELVTSRGHHACVCSRDFAIDVRV